MPHEQLSRRRFLGQLTAGAGLLLAGCATVAVYQGQWRADRVVLERETVEALLAEKGVVLVQAPGLEEPIALLRREDGSLGALGTRCPHLGCQVRPGPRLLTCPCHGSTFTAEGAVARGPAQKPLNRYPVEVREEQIEIEVY